MSLNNTDKPISKKTHRSHRGAEIVNTLEALITAVILALVFMQFVIQAFRIPTGSMADTLMGAHFRLRCPQCGYKYDYGFVPERYGFPQDYVPRRYLKSYLSRCPSCGHYQPTGGAMPISNGDRILVLRCIYQFFEPNRWDVVVFKNPLDPPINYIKRLIGRPGETLEIIDGDIYINGQIARKPPKVQNELWMPVYNNDYQPVRPREGSFNGHIWQMPFKNIEGSKWKIDRESPTKFSLDSRPDQINTLIYDTSIGNDFRDTYAYNDVREFKYMPYCSDLMTHFYACSTGVDCSVGIETSKYQTRYRAWVDSSGNMIIAEATNDQEFVELVRQQIEPTAMSAPTLVSFANVDHRLIFQFGREKLTHDLGRLPDDAGARATNIQPQVKIFGSGKLNISRIAISRDIHYTGSKFANGPKSGRAIEGNPFTLGKDEFFVLGDNSPNSEDCRWWEKPGKANNNLYYRSGIVPREYLVGKALFVYWPSGFRLSGKSRFAIIPNLGRMRFIYGGSDKNP